jgi:[ribosomal protein S5]-alanine N-acetyltransferase
MMKRSEKHWRSSADRRFTLRSSPDRHSFHPYCAMATLDADLDSIAVRLETERTVVRLAIPADAPGIVRFYTENRERLRPLDPARPPAFYEERFWRMQIRQNLEDYAADRALRLFVYPKADATRIIGNISFSNFVRGIGQYCTVGYSLDGEYEGMGIMSEALRAAIGYVFRNLGFHRIEANYMPHNVRSGALLRRLGFVVEGYSRDYLRIDGSWQDHLRTALLHPNWTDG